MSSPGCRYSSAASAVLFLVRYQCWLVSWASCSANRRWKGQPSFSRQRTSLPPPHARRSVHKNLHNGSRKCQYTGSTRIRWFWEDSGRPRCDLEGSAASSFPENNSANNESRVSRNGHALALVCDRETNILGNLDHKKAGAPLPDRILVASCVSAGRWSQTSLLFPPGVLLFCYSELVVCQIDSAQDCFTHSRKLPRGINLKLLTLQKKHSSSSSSSCLIGWRERGALSLSSACQRLTEQLGLGGDIKKPI